MAPTHRTVLFLLQPHLGDLYPRCHPLDDALITCHSNLTSSHVILSGLSVQQCWHCINFSTAQNSFPPHVCSECQRAPLCLPHYTPTHTRLIPTQMLFSLRKSSTCLICRAGETVQLWSITLSRPGYPANRGSASPD